MKRLLVPYDGSDNALRAVRHAIAAVQDSTAPGGIELLHVLDPTTFPTPAAAPGPDELTCAMPEEARRLLAPARKLLDDAQVPYEVRLRQGQAGVQIAEQSRERDYHGIVMGTRGMAPLAGMMIGSVATRVVHLVDLPVTLVK